MKKEELNKKAFNKKYLPHLTKKESKATIKKLGYEKIKNIGDTLDTLFENNKIYKK